MSSDNVYNDPQVVAALDRLMLSLLVCYTKSVRDMKHQSRVRELCAQLAVRPSPDKEWIIEQLQAQIYELTYLVGRGSALRTAGRFATYTHYRVLWNGSDFDFIPLTRKQAAALARY